MPVLLLFLAIVPRCAHSQGPIPPPSAPAEFPHAYSNSTDGLRLQLQDVLDVARQRNAAGLESLIRKMAIPDAANWFAKSYGSERAAGFASAYGSDLPRNESNLDALLRQLATDDGEFSVRKVNGAPAPGMEERMLDGLLGGSEIFFAGWKKRDASPNFRGRPVGYFVFADGSFRLIRAFDTMPMRPATGSGPAGPQGNWSAASGGAPDDPSASGPGGTVPPGVRVASPPRCDYCPDPEYSQAARKKHLQGTVALQVTVQPDGSATDLEVVKSPDPELSQMALDGVGKWRFKPALNSAGDAFPVRVPIEVTFRLAN